jgi:hypothetical protein
MTNTNADIYDTPANRASTNDSTRIDYDETYRDHQLRIVNTAALAELLKFALRRFGQIICRHL